MRSAFLFSVIVFCTFFSANAQLAGTKWQGTIKIPREDGSMLSFLTIWNFQGDTLSVSYVVGKLPTDVMAYSESNGVITLHKVTGSIPCDGEAVGKYAYEIKEDKLYIRKIDDACEVRGSVDVSQPFDKQKL